MSGDVRPSCVGIYETRDVMEFQSKRANSRRYHRDDIRKMLSVTGQRASRTHTLLRFSAFIILIEFESICTFKEVRIMLGIMAMNIDIVYTHHTSQLHNNLK